MKKRSILIADDNGDVTDVLYEIFTNKGYEVYKAYDGRAALEIYFRHRPQLLILDIDMPLRNGLEVAKVIKASDRSTLVVVLTGYMVSEKDALECLNNGVDFYLRKPLSHAEIYACINNLMTAILGTLNEIYYLRGFKLDMSAQILIDGTKEYPLTEREAMVLQILIKRKNQIVSLEEMANHVLHDEAHSSNVQMLRNIISNVKKLLCSDPAISIKSAYNKGYILWDRENDT